MNTIKNTSSGEILLSNGWKVLAAVDSDGHLNVYVENGGETISQIESDQGGGCDGEQLALRFTTDDIEESYKREMAK